MREEARVLVARARAGQAERVRVGIVFGVLVVARVGRVSVGGCGRLERVEEAILVATAAASFVHIRAYLHVHVVLAWYVAESGACQGAVDARRVFAQIPVLGAHVCVCVESGNRIEI